MNTSFKLTLTPGLAEALRIYAAHHHLNRSYLIRESIAAAIGYDLQADPHEVRPGRYLSHEAYRRAKAHKDAERYERTKLPDTP